MTTVVAKWGNSLAIRLPKALAEQVNVKEGTDITFTFQAIVL